MPPALRPSQRQGVPAAPAVCLAPRPHGRAWRRQLASRAAARRPLAEPAVCGTWPPLLLTSPIARTGSWPPQLPRENFNACALSDASHTGRNGGKRKQDAPAVPRSGRQPTVQGDPHKRKPLAEMDAPQHVVGVVLQWASPIRRSLVCNGAVGRTVQGTWAVLWVNVSIQVKHF